MRGGDPEKEPTKMMAAAQVLSSLCSSDGCPIWHLSLEIMLLDADVEKRGEVRLGLASHYCG